MNTDVLKAQIANGNWKPNVYLTNLSLAYFQATNDFSATKLFPIVPVPVASSYYYIFDKEDLTRDDMQRKPMFGEVAPVTLRQSDESYNCKIDQLIMGIDQLSNLNYERSGVPGVADPRKAMIRTVAEKINIHLESLFAKNFFQKGVWGTEFEGISSGTPTSTQFLRFDNDACDPVEIMDQLKLEIRRKAQRMPNKLVIGIEAYVALKHNPCIMERIKYTGSSANPAMVNTNVLAQLFEVDQVAVNIATKNNAGVGKDAEMDYICDPKGALLCYAPNSPSIDEPSAGYTFAWDMLGGAQYVAVTQYQGKQSEHAEFIEAIMAYDMKKTGDDLAVYLGDCVG